MGLETKLIFFQRIVWNQCSYWLLFSRKIDTIFFIKFWKLALTLAPDYTTKLLYFLSSHLYKSNAWVNGKNCQKMCILNLWLKPENWAIFLALEDNDKSAFTFHKHGNSQYYNYYMYFIIYQTYRPVTHRNHPTGGKCICKTITYTSLKSRF